MHEKKEQDKNIIYNNCSAFCCSHIAFVRPVPVRSAGTIPDGAQYVIVILQYIYFTVGTHTRSERGKNRVKKSLEMKCETMIPVLNPKLGKECIACWAGLRQLLRKEPGQDNICC